MNIANNSALRQAATKPHLANWAATTRPVRRPASYHLYLRNRCTAHMPPQIAGRIDLTRPHLLFFPGPLRVVIYPDWPDMINLGGRIDAAIHTDRIRRQSGAAVVNGVLGFGYPYQIWAAGSTVLPVFVGDP